MDTAGGIGSPWGLVPWIYCRGDRVTMGAGPMDTAGGIGSPWGLYGYCRGDRVTMGTGPMDILQGG